MPMEKSCGVIVRTSKLPRRYLILRYLQGHWSYAKGHIEPNETEQETALRELAEETGLAAIQLENNFRAQTQYDFGPARRRVSKKVIFFLGTTSDENVRLSSEHTDFAWLEFSAARKKLTFVNDRHVLDEVSAYLQTKGEQP